MKCLAPSFTVGLGRKTKVAAEIAVESVHRTKARKLCNLLVLQLCRLEKSFGLLKAEEQKVLGKGNLHLVAKEVLQILLADAGTSAHAVGREGGI